MSWQRVFQNPLDRATLRRRVHRLAENAKSIHYILRDHASALGTPGRGRGTPNELRRVADICDELAKQARELAKEGDPID